LRKFSQYPQNNQTQLWHKSGLVSLPAPFLRLARYSSEDHQDEEPASVVQRKANSDKQNPELTLEINAQYQDV
jgi:hypothetical protein